MLFNNSGQRILCSLLQNVMLILKRKQEFLYEGFELSCFCASLEEYFLQFGIWQKLANILDIVDPLSFVPLQLFQSNGAVCVEYLLQHFPFFICLRPHSIMNIYTQDSDGVNKYFFYLQKWIRNKKF